MAWRKMEVVHRVIVVAQTGRRNDEGNKEDNFGGGARGKRRAANPEMMDGWMKEGRKEGSRNEGGRVLVTWTSWSVSWSTALNKSFAAMSKAVLHHRRSVLPV